MLPAIVYGDLGLDAAARGAALAGSVSRSLPFDRPPRAADDWHCRLPKEWWYNGAGSGAWRRISRARRLPQRLAADGSSGSAYAATCKIMSKKVYDRGKRMAYIDFYLVPVSRDNKAAYEELARISAQVVRDYGALRVVECWLDESGPAAASYHAETARAESGEYPGFPAAAGAHAGETVVISCVEWPDKAARDAGMARVTGDPRMQFQDRPPVFDGRRLIAGGFEPILDQSRHDGL